ncbi:MAG: hypothetical protein ACK5Z5_08295 [Neisseriaceae bacterium]
MQLLSVVGRFSPYLFNSSKLSPKTTSVTKTDRSVALFHNGKSNTSQIGSGVNSWGKSMGYKNDILFENVRNAIKGINKQIDKACRVAKREAKIIVKAANEYFEDGYTIFISKKNNGLRHSILLYEDKGKYKILIKPNLSNKESVTNSPHLREGNSKFIKNAGMLITLNENKEFESICRVVTHSKHPNMGYKNLELEKCQDDSLKRDGFKKIKFLNSKGQERVIYIQEYCGEDLSILIRPRRLSIQTRLEIIKQLLHKYEVSTIGIHDIKLLNTVWDGEKASFIDYTDCEAFTYITKNFNSRLTISDYKRKLQNFTLCLLFFQLYQEWKNFNELIEFSKQFGTSIITSSLEINKLLKKYLANPFSGLLWELYIEDEEANNEFLQKVHGIIDNIKYEPSTNSLNYTGFECEVSNCCLNSGSEHLDNNQLHNFSDGDQYEVFNSSDIQDIPPAIGVLQEAGFDWYGEATGTDEDWWPDGRSSPSSITSLIKNIENLFDSFSVTSGDDFNNLSNSI